MYIYIYIYIKQSEKVPLMIEHKRAAVEESLEAWILWALSVINISWERPISKLSKSKTKRRSKGFWFACCSSEVGCMGVPFARCPLT
jgi:hypothetical protein